jgi:hypothetical protein
MGEWTYRGSTFTADDVGAHKAFVYVITNLTDGRRYVGKKLLWTRKVKTVNKKKKKILVQSDWPSYHGSSEELKRDVELLGEDSFSREILHLCAAPGEASYLEMKEQILRDVLLRKDYYNLFVGGKIHANHVKNLWVTDDRPPAR